MDGAGRCQEANRRPGRSSLATVTCSQPGKQRYCYHSFCAWYVKKQDKEPCRCQWPWPRATRLPLRILSRFEGSEEVYRLQKADQTDEDAQRYDTTSNNQITDIDLEVTSSTARGTPSGWPFERLDQRSPTTKRHGTSAGSCFYVKECKSAGVLHLRCRTGDNVKDHCYNALIDGELAPHPC